MAQLGPDERFQDFFRSFQTELGEYKYRQKLAQMSSANSPSLVVDFEDLLAFDSPLARELVEAPDEFVVYANKAVWAQMKIEDPEYAEGREHFFARFRKLPDKTPLRSIGAPEIDRLVLLDGIVVRSTPVKPLVVSAAFKCRRCGNTTLVDQVGPMMRGPGLCPSCRAPNPSYDLLTDESTYVNYQELRLQERPEDLPPGQLPRATDVKVVEDLVDSARPGDRVSVTGVVRAQQELVGTRGRLRTFDMFLDANFLDVIGKETEVIEISAQEERAIKELARDPWIDRKLLRSIAPSIYGYESIKEAILYLLFSGVPKKLPDGVSIRGDINVLLVGDPGTAKSQLLQYVARIAPRGLYTSGRGSTAAGLTAAVLREKTGGMVLEAGALVLADKGVAAIDEIDKMRPDDRVAIHEAMEQQTVSVAKGGIVATLNARASVLAAGNPAFGRYDPYRNINENINLPVTILSRFDLLFIMKDVPDADLDARMTDHILALHRTRAAPEEPPVETSLLKKYISYSKMIEPIISDEAAGELKTFYLKMRSSTGLETPITITPRQLEALVRLSEARARAFLREEVTIDDAKAAIRLMRASLENVGVDISTGAMDIDVIMTGKPKSTRDRMAFIMDAVTKMEKETGVVDETALLNELIGKMEVTEEEARRLLVQLIREGVLYSPKTGVVRRTSA
ncbi:MAG: minichromosome maintenance protein MCM [archaeon]